jgi:hypothetical protein
MGAKKPQKRLTHRPDETTIMIAIVSLGDLHQWVKRGLNKSGRARSAKSDRASRADAPH